LAIAATARQVDPLQSDLIPPLAEGTMVALSPTVWNLALLSSQYGDHSCRGLSCAARRVVTPPRQYARIENLSWEKDASVNKPLHLLVDFVLRAAAWKSVFAVPFSATTLDVLARLSAARVANGRVGLVSFCSNAGTHGVRAAGGVLDLRATSASIDID
jgi:hypothetical protein